MTSEALPRSAHTHPDLRHRHPESLRLVLNSQHHISHLGVENTGVADHHDLGPAQVL